MSPTMAYDYEALLSPLPDDVGDGLDLKSLGVHDQVKALRHTDDPVGAVEGNLRKGEAKVADWSKVVDICAKELTTRSKDIQLAVWFSEALARTRGIHGLAVSAKLMSGLLENFWTVLYPRIEEEGDLDMRAGRLEEYDRLLAKSCNEFTLTKMVDGNAYQYWQWHQIRKMEEDAHRADPDTRDDAMAEARQRREALDNAITKTDKKFYVDLHGILMPLQEDLERLRVVTDDAFRNDPGYYSMEETPPNYKALSNAVEGLVLLVEEIVALKGGFDVPPGESQGHGGGNAYVDSGGGGAIVRNPGSIDPISRADALERLNAIAKYFQRSEPHSPVAYLVIRAARWGNMTLPTWLEEVVGDHAVLSKLRETLGLDQGGGGSSSEE